MGNTAVGVAMVNPPMGNPNDDDEGTLWFPDNEMSCNDGQHCTRRFTGCRFAHQNTKLIRLMNYLETAKQSVDVCVFHITSNQLASTLQRLHQGRRKICVRIISDYRQATEGNPNADNVLHRLVNAGIEVRLSIPGGKVMHHKFAVVDKQLPQAKFLINGSFNWTHAAALHNHENVTISRNCGRTENFGHQFEIMWSKFAQMRPLQRHP